MVSRRIAAVVVLGILVSGCGKEEAAKPWKPTFPEWRKANATPEEELKTLEEAKERGKGLVAAVLAGNESEVAGYRGKVVSLSGYFVGGGSAVWIFKTPEGVSCDGVVGRNRQYANVSPLRVRKVTATGPFKSAVLKDKEMVLDDVDLILDTWAGG